MVRRGADHCLPPPRRQYAVTADLRIGSDAQPMLPGRTARFPCTSQRSKATMTWWWSSCPAAQSRMSKTRQRPQAPQRAGGGGKERGGKEREWGRGEGWRYGGQAVGAPADASPSYPGQANTSAQGGAQWARLGRGLPARARSCGECGDKCRSPPPPPPPACAVHEPATQASVRTRGRLRRAGAPHCTTRRAGAMRRPSRSFSSTARI